MQNEPVTVADNVDANRYEVKIGNQLAVLTYERQADRIIFLHTGVPPALEGHGVANALAHFALEDARSQKLAVVPVCRFVASYIRRHPEYQSLVVTQA
jgi:predicted GNAT family acetyltransferase